MTGVEIMGKITSRKHSRSPDEPGMNGTTDQNSAANDPNSTIGLPAYSDEVLALDFGAKFEGELHYVPAWSKWMYWTGTHWAEDNKLIAFSHARDHCREAARKAKATEDYKKKAKQLASGNTGITIERIVKADKRLVATADVWDLNPMILNTPAGTVDLKTGELKDHDREDCCTKITAVEPAQPGTPCPIWDKFLFRVADENEELIAFLKRSLGYAVTGRVSEHCLFFFYGTGRNGKSVFLNTISNIMANYACSPPREAFTVSRNERHPTDIAMLKGARIAVVQETERGKKWDESRIKHFTGNDPITARLMRQDFSTFLPQFALFFAGNHKPGLSCVDEAIKARFHMIPFTVTIPEAERDPDLSEKLKSEWPAILRWMIDGCLEWQREGLNPPAVVSEATDEYFAQEDALSLWMEEKIHLDVNAEEKSANLYNSWKKWAENAGEYIGSKRSLTQALKDKGFDRGRTSGSRKIRGLRCLDDQADLDLSRPQ